MSELRRMLLANATEQASNGGGDLPTNIVVSTVPNEDNARIYEYLKSLRIGGYITIQTINSSGSYIYISGGNQRYDLYSDGRFGVGGSGD